jgi:hypothetical protein
VIVMMKVRMRGRGGVRSDNLSGGDGPLGDVEEQQAFRWSGGREREAWQRA